VSMSIKLAWQQIPSTVISDILCQNNLDGVVLDTEHGCYNNEILYACIQIITANNKKCFVRLTDVDKTMIRLCLDAGANGLIFSTVETVHDAYQIDNFCKFPKYGGLRGLGLVRENKWGDKDLVSEPPIIIAQIETKQGVDNLDKLMVFKFDYYMIGPYDLSASYGAPGKFDSREYLDAVKKINNLVPKEKMAVHIPKDVKNQIKKYKNYGIIAVGMDTTILNEKYKELAKC